MRRNAAVRALRARSVPTWWRDAKLGIFIHWTPASVPGFAPTEDDIGDLLGSTEPNALARSPYSEWYENSLRFPDSPVSQHHAQTYGTKPYREFADEWQAGLESWDPDAWAEHFHAAGARYVVLVTKHHDGFCLWPTTVENPHMRAWHSRRDVVGELAEAVRARGLRFGVYYSGGLDSTWNDHPVGSMSDLAFALPRGKYVDYARAQVRELIDRYRPSVLWNDIAWPEPTARLASLLEHYYAQVPDGVVNDRFLCWSPAWELMRARVVRRAIDRSGARQVRAGGLVPPKPSIYGVRTPEYTTFEDIQSEPWECVRGIDRSFGFNRASTEEHFLTRADLVWSLVDIASKGGNLLLNVGPRGEDAQIPDTQLRRLDWLANATEAIGAGLYATRPWVTPGTVTAEGSAVRYTARDRTVYAIVAPDTSRCATLVELRATPTTKVTSAGEITLEHRGTDAGIEIGLPDTAADTPRLLCVGDARAI